MAKNILNILIADDDPEDIELVEEAILHLEPEANLVKFFNGRTALEYLHSSLDHELPCLIVLDYNMPELNAAEILSLMRSKQRYDLIPKVILSTSNAHIHQYNCIRNGALEYIVKPNSMQGLALLANKLLAYCRCQR
jgi:CheY-like chemotaxis protein